MAGAYEVTFIPNYGRERDVYGRLLGRVMVDGVDSAAPRSRRVLRRPGGATRRSGARVSQTSD
jgi:hypothetical protein